MLEAMQGAARSRSAKKTYRLPDPFLVLATQNPLERKELIRGPKHRRSIYDESAGRHPNRHGRGVLFSSDGRDEAHR